MLYVLVGTRFQVLFHSPPGVLFTFPSQYYTLSVIGEYLGLEGGPPVFPPGFTCLPRSLATTSGISVDFFSSPYLDVSVQEVPYSMLFYSQGVDRVLLCRVSPFGNPRIIACFRLPVAFRRSLRPSSATNAKASPLRPF